VASRVLSACRVAPLARPVICPLPESGCRYAIPRSTPEGRKQLVVSEDDEGNIDALAGFDGQSDRRERSTRADEDQPPDEATAA